MTRLLAGAREVVGELLEHPHRGDVDERDRLGVEHHADACPAAAARAWIAVAHRVGVGEEQPGLDAQHGDARLGRVLRVAVDVAELAGGAGHAAELGDVRLATPGTAAAAATRRCR